MRGELGGDADAGPRTELERAFLLISSQPSLAPPALDPGLEQVRRLHLYRIGYYLY